MAPVSFVTRSGQRLILDGQDFAHIGVNSAGLAHYGSGPLRAKLEDQATQLDAARCMGARVVRILGANSQLDRVRATDNIARLADLAYNTYGLRLLVCLTDVYAGWHHPQGDDWFYNGGQGVWAGRLLGRDWFVGGWQDNYLPWLFEVVGRLKSHPGIFAWEIGNELLLDNGQEELVGFMGTAAGHIRSVDNDHLIASGLLNTGHPNLSYEQAVRMYQNFDIVTVHSYDGDHSHDDIAVAAGAGIAHIVEEANYERDAAKPNTNRTLGLSSDLYYWVESGLSSGYYPWGFMATKYDNGDGDSRLGMDYVFPYHDDYAALYAMFQSRTGASCIPTVGAATPEPTPQPYPVPGEPTPGISASPTLPLPVIVAGGVALALFGYGVYRLSTSEEGE